MASVGRGSRQKGAAFELKMSKKISKWWGGTFSRTPGSGSLHWGNDQRVAGDIVPPQGMDFPFVIECKKHEGFTIENVMLNTGEPSSWWQQVITDSRRVGKVPMLIFSRNRAKVFVMIPYDEKLYSLLSKIGTAVMRTTVDTKNIRDEVQKFDVLITTYDVITQVPIPKLKSYAKNVDWDPYKEEYITEG